MSTIDLSQMSREELLAYAQRLQENQQRKVSLTMSDAGYIEVYGLPGKGRFSISLPPEGWDATFKLQDTIMEFVNAHRKNAEARFNAYKATAKAKAAVKAVG
jgi:hypothetical protein